MQEYFIGIDGGGTSCRAAVADAEGRILGRGRSGASNILTDPDTALRHIEEAARLAFRDAGLAEDLSAASALLGVAGNNVGDAVSYVLARLPFARAEIVSDGLIALQGALGDADGAIAIVGTGTIFIVRHQGRIHYLGGWGFQVGDLGGGARLGHAALQESLLAHDGIRPGSALTKRILDEFGHDPKMVVDFARAARPGDFGRHAPTVVAFAAEGDPTALRLMRDAASQVDEALDAAARIDGGTGRLCLLGGLAEVYSAYLADRHRDRLAPPLADALTGAVELAVKTLRTGAP
ncbi:N-acetylglucosamine kinase [Pseudorhizobium endolithicum]|uniref:N-acetylglucosamine kinase n=1 Tax=Pseudorhizobium endolithicum TaxID=1191678 RepID=A0ABN7JGQ1_9HYPH|nr:N-acetylglucosamine kinase [Pseudorhizobium endolithicum]CAD7030434.1 N-acetylglucosamine kinase [Pseudorhizobium endolithicum]